MLPPGRKPTNIPLLTVWEFEWYKAFHLLRDATQLPTAPLLLPPKATPEQIKERIEWLERGLERARLHGDYNQLWTEHRRRGTLPHGFDPLTLPEKAWIEKEAVDEMTELKRYLEPKRIYALAERRGIWSDLVRARTVKAVEDACRKWKRLADIRAKGDTCFPAYVSANAKAFLSMKRNPRFPGSDYADDSRLDYFARGMAGVMVGLSPMTAIERLRNMKHGLGGPCWRENEQRCCWRCDRSEFTKIEQLLRLEEQVK